MSTESSFSKTEKTKAWQIFNRYAGIIALIASLATIVGLLIQVQSKNRLLEIQVLSADQLTKLPSVTGLDGQFTYNGISVTDLWRVRLRLLNNGDTTLVGLGSSSSLLSSMVTISFPQGVNIIDASPKTGSFYSITQPTPNSIGVEFSQWRRGEEFELIVFLASNAVLQAPPMPSILDRPIVDGDVHIINLISSSSSEPQQAIDYLPAPIALVGKILGGLIISTICSVSFVWLVIVSPISYFRAQLWRLKHLDLLKKHIDNFPLPDKVKREFINKPWSLMGRMLLGVSSPISKNSLDKLKAEINKADADAELKQKKIMDNIKFSSPEDEENFWKKFQVSPPPYPTFETFWGTFVGFVIGLILTASSAAIIASMITV